MASRSSLVSQQYLNDNVSPLITGDIQTMLIGTSQLGQGASSVENPYASHRDNPARFYPTLEITSGIDVSNVQDPYASQRVGEHAMKPTYAVIVLLLFLTYIIGKSQ